MNQILIGVDGSPASRQVIRRGSELATTLDVRAVLAFVNPQLAPLGPDAEIPAGWAEQLREQGRTLLGEAAAVCGWSAPPAQELADGPVAETLVAIARKLEAEMIVVGSNGHRALAGVMLGSVAYRLAQIADRPVLLLPHDGGRADRPLLLQRILVGTDGSAEARKAVDLARSLGRRTGAQLTLAHAISPPAHHARVLAGFAWWEESAKDYGQRLVQDEAARIGGDCKTVVSIERPAALLRTVADEIDADLVVVGRRGLGELRRVFVGSVADEVLRGCHRPVLVSH
jgi:nucleotide-binding universal stress UspA family protein